MFAFAFVMGMVAGAMILASILPNHLLLGDGRLQWEVLFTGVVALLAAVVTFRQLQRQIQQTQEIEQGRRDARLLAVRSVLPLTLSALVEYIESETAVLRAMKSRAPGQASAPVPGEVVEVLKEFVEFARQPQAEAVRQILSDIQIHAARMRRDMPRFIANHAVFTNVYLAGNLFRLVTTYAVASEMFRYARFETENVTQNPDYPQTEAAALQLDVFDDDDVMALVRDRFDIPNP